jgi:ADP-L-glycero-D-manno-heptose 6-epimerase
MRILVTGGTGFIGSHLVRRLAADGHDLLITGHEAEQKLPNFRGRFLHPSLTGISWSALGGLDVVFHEAAANDTTFLDREEMLRVNLASSQELFHRAVANGCRRIVYASSTAVYGNAPSPYREDGPVNPLNPYAESKLRLDEFAMEFAREHRDVTVVGLRYCNVYGPGEDHKGTRASMIHQLARQILAGRNPRIFKFGEQRRDYIYVEDVVRANLLALEASASFVVNCGAGTSTSFNELIEILNAALGTRRSAEYIDNPYADAYQSHTECDMSFAREKLGFVPRFDLRAGIAAYADHGFLPSL